MRLTRKEINVQTSADTDIIDLTAELRNAVAESGVQDGTVVVFVPGSTAGITTIEYETGAVADLKRAIEQLAPRGASYEHNLRWGDGNGYSHVRAALLGPSLTIPLVGGAAVLGTWQQVILCDFDNRARTRRVVIQVLGSEYEVGSE